MKPIHKAGGIITRTSDTGKIELYVIHRPRYDDWSVPKGHIDAGETPEQAALREVFEETGLQCTITRALEPYHYTLPSGEESIIFFFEMRVRAMSNPLDSEADEGRWVALADIDTLLSYPHQNTYIRRVLAEEASA